jgi:Zn-dependent peptidase ImmA (M78 family)/DNA-binding XRE family transcriptional regulator
MTELAPNLVGRRLQWFRDRRSMSQATVCEAVGIKSAQTLSEIEAGKRRVSPEELVKLAGVFDVALDELLDPFRLVGEGGFNFRVNQVEPSAVEAFAGKAGRWIATYREIGRRNGMQQALLGKKLELTASSSYEDARASADELVREWKLGAVPARKLEHALEREMDALILYVDAPHGLSGAASTLPGLHTILVNRQEAPARRAFDLAHELFHLMTWDAMPPAFIEAWETPRKKGNRVETLANCFASALLMPTDVMHARWAKRGTQELTRWLVATAIQLQVSPIALQWRLVSLDLLTEGQVRPIPNDGVAAGEQPTLFSRKFVERVCGAVEAGQLSLRRAATLLDLSVYRFTELCKGYELALSYES